MFGALSTPSRLRKSQSQSFFEALLRGRRRRSERQRRALERKNSVAEFLEDRALLSSIAIMETDGSTAVNEFGSTDTFDVVLSGQPTSDVVVNISSANPSEVVPSTSSAAPLLVVDNFEEGAFNISVDAGGSGVVDEIQSGLSPSNNVGSLRVASLYLTSGTSASFQLLPTAGDDAAVFEVAANSTATAKVQIRQADIGGQSYDLGATNGDRIEVTLADAPAAGTITLALQDNTDNGMSTSLPVTGPGTYTFRFNEMSAAAAFNIADMGQTDLFIEGEAGASAQSYAIADISIPFATSLTFTPGNWDVPQAVTVTGVDDAVIDGDQLTVVTATVNDVLSDNAFDPAPDQIVLVTTEDNENGPSTGSITGMKFEDINGDGVQDAGEGPLAGVTIYVDANDNGILDAGELSTQSLADGTYQLNDVPIGQQVVREVVPSGFVQTTPVANDAFFYAVAGAANELITINAASGLVDHIGLFGTDMNGLAHTRSGELFGLKGTGTDGFYSIDTTTGAATLIGNTGEVVFGLAYSDATDTIYTIRGLGTTRNLASIDRTTGATTIIGSGSSAVSNVSGIAFDAANNQVIAFDNLDDEFWGFDVNTGNVTLLSDTSNFAGYGFTPVDDSFVMSTTAGNVDEIDPFTATATPYLMMSETLGIDALDYVPASTGEHRVTVTAGTVRDHVDFGNRQATGDIQGTKFEDINGDGIQNIGEGPLVGVTIYLDANDNGALDTGEVSTTTDANGDYAFANVPAGDHVVREEIPAGFVQTSQRSQMHIFMPSSTTITSWLELMQRAALSQRSATTADLI